MSSSLSLYKLSLHNYLSSAKIAFVNLSILYFFTNNYLLKPDKHSFNFSPKQTKFCLFFFSDSQELKHLFFLISAIVIITFFTFFRFVWDLLRLFVCCLFASTVTATEQS